MCTRTRMHVLPSRHCLPPPRTNIHHSMTGFAQYPRFGLLAAVIACTVVQGALGESRWANIAMAPPDPILGVAAAYNADPATKKVNLGIGAYRDENGKPLVLRCVREAEKQIANDESLNKEYIPIQGLEAFLKVTTDIIFGKESSAVKEGRVAVVQTLSGTGALRVAGGFLQKWHPGKNVYISDPSWGNHHGIFQQCGMTTQAFRYLTPSMKLDIEGMLADLRAADKGSIFVLHTVAHNPTGVDPSQEQWLLIAEVCKEREAIVIFDTAYQGYASGDLEKDAWAVRYFVNDLKMEVFVTQSYSKNFGLYGERIGALSIVNLDDSTAEKVLSQLKAVIRPMYSSPQLHGARLVATVLNDESMTATWKSELKHMSDRIISMRVELVNALSAVKCPPPNANFADYSHITSQIGMFAYTGLSKDQCHVLTDRFHIYCTKNGRFSMAGVNPGNVGFIAQAMKEAIASAPQL
mmetsp:Transcript_98462/g.158776  ORF Transcript_98462/g.158776 Transcript_98462/m.158776 type:complete len:466 (+) Transcript_98462:234-1631(+)